MKCQICKQIKQAKNQLYSINKAISSAKDDYALAHWKKCAEYWENEIKKLEDADPEIIAQREKAEAQMAFLEKQYLGMAKYIAEKLDLVHSVVEENGVIGHAFVKYDDKKPVYQVVLRGVDVMILHDHVYDYYNKKGDIARHENAIKMLLNLYRPPYPFRWSRVGRYVDDIPRAN